MLEKGFIIYLSDYAFFYEINHIILKYFLFNDQVNVVEKVFVILSYSFSPPEEIINHPVMIIIWQYI